MVVTGNVNSAREACNHLAGDPVEKSVSPGVHLRHFAQGEDR